MYWPTNPIIKTKMKGIKLAKDTLHLDNFVQMTCRNKNVSISEEMEIGLGSNIILNLPT